MALTNAERVGKGLELLMNGLAPFVKRELESKYGRYWIAEVTKTWRDSPTFVNDDEPNLDVALLLRLIWDEWSTVFSKTLSRVDRSIVSELREVRNTWAHQKAFTSDDADRALDSIFRLLTSVSAPQADEARKMREELRRTVYEEQARAARRQMASASVVTENGGASNGLPPWREVATPHPDVRTGTYQTAEFAADLWQVHLGEATSEYNDPTEFFRRTYLTTSLERLLVNAARRLAGEGGDPVVQLQTNFGGGKTHSMLALYHLFSGRTLDELPGAEDVLTRAGIATLPSVRRVVIVGTRLSPGRPIEKRDGTVVRTVWGEIAYQLGGREAFARIRDDDERATNPGDALRQLFDDYGPCLILIDEWVAYARQLHDEPGLPGGTFETQFTFAQTLTECARTARHCLLVVSLPASDTRSASGVDEIEVGGIRGREALRRLNNVIGRVDNAWRPATAEEGFEIVRRRLFQPLSPDQFKKRDVVARAFVDFYREHHGEFPAECAKPEYEKRIREAYPIHPEVFDRLYGDWSTLPRFQRTRGVLRLMAVVIATLWDTNDRSPLILPGTIPLDDPRVQSELTRYLEDQWAPIIERDVAGKSSTPAMIDEQESQYGRYRASQRVARTVFLGSAPLRSVLNRGVEDKRIKLGSVLKGESPAVFGDALRRLSTRATYLYQEGDRYWYDIQPTVTKLADDLVEDLKRDDNRHKVIAEIKRRVEADTKSLGEFSRRHVFPGSGADVSDDRDARLVILSPDHAHSKESKDSKERSEAVTKAKAIWESRESSPRRRRNTLLFLAADRSELTRLEENARRFLAWQSILQNADQYNLTPSQRKQAEQQAEQADKLVTSSLRDTYVWLIAPRQDDPRGPIEWSVIRLSGPDSLAMRASKKAIHDGLLETKLGPASLRGHLDDVPLWNGDHVSVKDLVEYFASYVYLPRLKDERVLCEAIQRGLSHRAGETETFAYAEGFDEARNQYRGLRAGWGQQQQIVADDPGLLVRAEVAARQMRIVAPTRPDEASRSVDSEISRMGRAEALVTASAPEVKFRRYHGTVELDANRLGLSASRIQDDIISHLIGVRGAKVKVTLEIQVTAPDGFGKREMDIVRENGAALKFTNNAFEEE